MFQSKKPKSLRSVRHARKFRLCTDASDDTRCSCVLSTQLPRVIAVRSIHHGPVMDGAEFLVEPMKFLVDMLNQAHLFRISNERTGIYT